MLNKKKLGLKETSPGSGVFTCPKTPEEFWRRLRKVARKGVR